MNRTRSWPASPTLPTTNSRRAGLLTDLVRVLGDHPDALITRGNLASRRGRRVESAGLRPARRPRDVSDGPASNRVTVCLKVLISRLCRRVIKLAAFVTSSMEGRTRLPQSPSGSTVHRLMLRARLWTTWARARMPCMRLSTVLPGGCWTRFFPGGRTLKRVTHGSRSC